MFRAQHTMHTLRRASPLATKNCINHPSFYRWGSSEYGGCTFIITEIWRAKQHNMPPKEANSPITTQAGSKRVGQIAAARHVLPLSTTYPQEAYTSAVPISIFGGHQGPPWRKSQRGWGGGGGAPQAEGIENKVSELLTTACSMSISDLPTFGSC